MVKQQLNYQIKLDIVQMMDGIKSDCYTIFLHCKEHIRRVKHRGDYKCMVWREGLNRARVVISNEMEVEDYMVHKIQSSCLVGFQGNGG